jgi:hypothetical protein
LLGVRLLTRTEFRVAELDEPPQFAVIVAAPPKVEAAVNVVVGPEPGLNVPALLGVTDHVGSPLGKLLPPTGDAVKPSEVPAQISVVEGLTLVTPTTV